MSDTADPTDHFRTTCPHAGEFFIDRLCWPGLLAIVLGVASLVGGVAAAAYGHREWVLTLVGVGIPVIVGGLVWLALEHRRVLRMESRWLSVYSAGSSAVF
ncbi:protein UsfY [Mycobacterium stomatepiae]|uniref:UsfY protein n=1 Tax=Mycobacterium stomatepiae TaxID=470076 RepID=A0A7I7Q6H5_9MYCO|nr:protein UsfY [Mycobacterium stomatepiae]BBY21863.1 UsfY protein [Mycobacterium stomatepiae]